MKKFSQILLITAVVTLLGGFLESLRPGSWGIGIPLGVVFLGLYAIAVVFGPQAEAFDAEERERVAEAEQAMSRPIPPASR